MDTGEIIDISNKFDQSNLPLDVLWLDIEVNLIIDVHYFTNLFSIQTRRSTLHGIHQNSQM